jgi:hypothetical protein
MLTSDRPEFGILDRIESAAASAERGKIVSARSEMNGDPLVPVVAIGPVPLRYRHVSPLLRRLYR